ncbi:hypothetical protein GCM10027167_24710 [Nocardia heshunensis]
MSGPATEIRGLDMQSVDLDLPEPHHAVGAQQHPAAGAYGPQGEGAQIGFGAVVADRDAGLGDRHHHVGDGVVPGQPQPAALECAAAHAYPGWQRHRARIPDGSGDPDIGVPRREGGHQFSGRGHNGRFVHCRIPFGESSGGRIAVRTAGATHGRMG